MSDDLHGDATGEFSQSRKRSGLARAQTPLDGPARAASFSGSARSVANHADRPNYSNRGFPSQEGAIPFMRASKRRPLFGYKAKRPQISQSIVLTRDKLAFRHSAMQCASLASRVSAGHRKFKLDASSAQVCGKLLRAAE